MWCTYLRTSWSGFPQLLLSQIGLCCFSSSVTAVTANCKQIQREKRKESLISLWIVRCHLEGDVFAPFCFTFYVLINQTRNPTKINTRCVKCAMLACSSLARKQLARECRMLLLFFFSCMHRCSLTFLKTFCKERTWCWHISQSVNALLIIEDNVY